MVLDDITLHLLALRLLQYLLFGRLLRLIVHPLLFLGLELTHQLFPIARRLAVDDHATRVHRGSSACHSSPRRPYSST